MQTRVKLSAKLGGLANGGSSPARRSEVIVSRGLRDLARNSNWAIKRIFPEPAAALSVSRTGLLCLETQQEPSAANRITIYDVEGNRQPIALPLTRSSEHPAGKASMLFAWSPTARYLAIFFAGAHSQAVVFDLGARGVIEMPKGFSGAVAAAGWSRDGKYLGIATPPPEASLWLWESHFDANGRMLLGERAASRFDLRQKSSFSGAILQAAHAAFAPNAHPAEGQNEGTICPPIALGRFAFSPNGKFLATPLGFSNGWSDDAVAFLTVPALEVRNIFAAQGRMTQIDWSSDGQQVIVCSSGQAYRLDCKEAQATELPFSADLCACHPSLSICLCFSAQAGSGLRGRLFLTEMRHWKVFDEIAVDGIADLSWNEGGSKAYAATNRGTAYIYEPPVM